MHQRADERLSALALSLVPRVGEARFKDLMNQQGSASAALRLFPDEAPRAAEQAATLLSDANGRGVRLLLSLDADYPSRLRDLEFPPVAIWAKGDLSILDRRPGIAIVGTRRATAYGLRVTREIATALTRAGAWIASGLARGIDAAAHVAALDADGSTVAVLGTGLDRVYPPAHGALQRTIGENGLLLSELAPDDLANGGSFARRNRLIAALVDAVLVVEAPLKSGALKTAGDAADLGRSLGAVPGPIDSPQSAGSNQLLRDSAIAICSADDALALVGLSSAVPAAPSFESDAEREVWSVLGDGGSTLDALCATTRLPAYECVAAVGALELRGIVACELSGEIRRRA